jgi:RNA polymerase-binding transcription factor DksA
MDRSIFEDLLRAELVSIQAPQRAWSEEGRPEAVMSHGRINLVDSAQGAAAVESYGSDGSRLADRVRGLLHALEHLHAGRYGVCDDWGGTIPAARLLAMPATTRCFTCQVAIERRTAPATSGDDRPQPRRPRLRRSRLP